MLLPCTVPFKRQGKATIEETLDDLLGGLACRKRRDVYQNSFPSIQKSTGHHDIQSRKRPMQRQYFKVLFTVLPLALSFKMLQKCCTEVCFFNAGFELHQLLLCNVFCNILNARTSRSTCVQATSHLCGGYVPKHHGF